MARSTKHAWRRLATVATIAAALFATTATITAPAHASGQAVGNCTFASDSPRYVGWATLAYRGCPNGVGLSPGCKVVSAFRWTGSAWQSRSLNECVDPIQVYVYPYAAGWSWIWSQQTGWLAVRSSLVLLHQGYGNDCPNCAIIN